MSDPVTPPKWVVAAFLATALLVSAWLMLRVNSSAEARECRARYQAARTAADTAVVDLLVPAHGTTNREAHRCGFIRASARW